MINERKNPEALRRIKANHDNLYNAELNLVKIKTLINKHNKRQLNDKIQHMQISL